jgi:hypothetical protein
MLNLSVVKDASIVSYGDTTPQKGMVRLVLDRLLYGRPELRAQRV